MDKKELGQFGENIVCDYLGRKGYRILGRNYIKIWDDKTKGEIDIIVKKDKTICFVEVKTIIDGSGFFPEDKVNYKKQKKLIKLAQTWLLEKGIPLDSFWQIDVAGVVAGQDIKKAKISYFENVVSES